MPAGGPAPLEVRLEQALDTARDLKAMSIKALNTARAAEQEQEQQQKQQQQLEERLHALGDELARARRYTSSSIKAISRLYKGSIKALLRIY